MAWYHVGGCSCPVGCCDCGPPAPHEAAQRQGYEDGANNLEPREYSDKGDQDAYNERYLKGYRSYLDKLPVPEGKVVFLGSNPSCSSPFLDPFSHCKSANTMLNQWIPAMGLTRDQVYFMNVANYKTPKNRPLKQAEISWEARRLRQLLDGQVVVTLGKAAQKAVAIAFKEFVARLGADGYVIHEDFPLKGWIRMPHPSGRNRQLNDRAYVEKVLEDSKVIIQNHMKGNK
jgi:uracil-DNA glycosylase family 4